jgi:antitoxin (DNA-binding transcriptional repressor) of toxin-antitoxin stability system
VTRIALALTLYDVVLLDMSKNRAYVAGLDLNDSNPRFSGRMKSLTVTEAKSRLGDLVDRALRSEPIFLRRGKRMVQIVPATVPDPVPVLPEGALTMTEDRIAFINSMPDDSDPPPR